jgi:hypothetical protein
MKPFIGLLLLILLAGLSAGCESGTLFGDLSWLPPPTPMAEPPAAESLEEEFLIRVAWPFDDAAEESVLYRSEISEGGIWTEVYRGSGTVFHDREAEHGHFYFYRLVRLQGGREFPAAGTAWGVGTDTRRDGSEPNDTSETAALMGSETLSANSFIIRDGQGHCIEDTDWYKVTVRGGHTVTLLFDHLENLTPEDLLVTVSGDEPARPTGYIRIVNYLPGIRDIPFSVRIDADRLFPDPSLPVFLTGHYRIRFISETVNP